MTEYQGSYTPPGGPPKKPAKERDRALIVRRGEGHLKGEALSVSLGTSVVIRNGLPRILYGEDAGCVLLPMVYLHPKFGVLKTVDAHWTGKVWKIALAKPAEACPDCNGEACSICGGEGTLFIPAGDTIQDACARLGVNRFAGPHQDDWAETKVATGKVNHQFDSQTGALVETPVFRGEYRPVAAPPTPAQGPGGKEARCPKCQAKKCPTCKGKGKITPIIWVLKSYLRAMGQPIPVKPGNTNRVSIRSASKARR